MLLLRYQGTITRESLSFIGITCISTSNPFRRIVYLSFTVLVMELDHGPHIEFWISPLILCVSAPFLWLELFAVFVVAVQDFLMYVGCTSVQTHT